MTQLDDLLGSLLSQIGEARLQADEASLELARKYAESDLLKHLPVPRVKIPTIEISLPVLIEQTDTSTSYDSSVGIDKRSIVNDTYAILKNNLVAQYPQKQINRTEYVGITRRLFTLADTLETELTGNGSIEEAKNKFIANSIDGLVGTKSIRRATRTPVISKTIKTELAQLLNRTLPVTRSSELRIKAQSDAIRELKDPAQQAMVLKFTISEENIELTRKAPDSTETAANGMISKRSAVSGSASDRTSIDDFYISLE